MHDRKAWSDCKARRACSQRRRERFVVSPGGRGRSPRQPTPVLHNRIRSETDTGRLWVKQVAGQAEWTLFLVEPQPWLPSCAATCGVGMNRSRWPTDVMHGAGFGGWPRPAGDRTCRSATACMPGGPWITSALGAAARKRFIAPHSSALEVVRTKFPAQPSPPGRPG